MKPIRAIPAFIFALAALAVPAQSRVVLSYFEDRSGELRIVNRTGDEEKFSSQLSFGDEVPVGWTVVTGRGDSAELTLEANGTIIKVAENTNFKVEGLQGLGEAKANVFTLGYGKFRAVAARTLRKDRYEVRGQTTVAGVRGTDFGMRIELGVEEAFVFKGSIDFRKLDTGTSIVLNAGESADALAATFAPSRMSAQKLAELEGALRFQRLDPASVPAAVETTEAPPAEPKAPAEGGFLDWLLGALGVEIGSLTVGDQTYAKAVIAPTISLNKLKMQLYLPIIYQNDMFDPGDWYRPRGNNEWSFGADQGDDWLEIARDFAGDLALKFKYLQYGDQRDPLFFKLGNLSNFTVGHGLVMRNYANDSDFPAVRRIGFNLGMDLRTIGFEAVVNDLADVQIVGGRLYLRPTPETFPLAIGASGIVDLYPARVLGESDPAQGGVAGELWQDVIGDPMLINVGLDVDYPIIERPTAALVMFADIAGLMPYYRKDGAGGFADIDEGLDMQALWSSGDGLRNYGAVAGVLGHVGPLAYRGEYRYFTGAFIPSIFDNAYERERGSYALRTARYTVDPSADEFTGLTMGIYGEAGYTWERVFSFTAGYFWPFTIADGRWEPEERDALHLEARLERGVIPFANIAVAVAYDRTYFVPFLLGGRMDDGTAYGFFDANTVVRGTLWYGVSRNVDIVVTATTSLARDADGDVIYDGDEPELATTVSIETQIHF